MFQGDTNFPEEHTSSIVKVRNLDLHMETIPFPTALQSARLHVCTAYNS